MRNETKSKCLPKFYVSSKQDKEYYRKTTPYLEQPSRHVSSSFMRRKRLKPLTVPLETKKKNNNYSFQSRWIVALGIFTSISKNNCQFPDLISLLLLSRLLLSVSFIYIYIYIYISVSRFMFGQKNKKKRQRQKVFLILILTSFLLFSKNVLSQFQVILSWSARKSKDYIL